MVLEEVAVHQQQVLMEPQRQVAMVEQEQPHLFQVVQ
jgi:uncharacterized protein YcfL